MICPCTAHTSRFLFLNLLSATSPRSSKGIVGRVAMDLLIPLGRPCIRIHFTINSELSPSPNLTKSEGLQSPGSMMARSLSILTYADSSNVEQRCFCRFLHKSFMTGCHQKPDGSTGGRIQFLHRIMKFCDVILDVPYSELGLEYCDP